MRSFFLHLKVRTPAFEEPLCLKNDRNGQPPLTADVFYGPPLFKTTFIHQHSNPLLHVSSGVVDGYSTDEEESDSDDDVKAPDQEDDESLDEEEVEKKIEKFNKLQMVRIKKLEGNVFI